MAGTKYLENNATIAANLKKLDEAMAGGYTIGADDNAGEAVAVNKTIKVNGTGTAAAEQTNIYTTFEKDENGNAAIEVALGEHVDVTDVTTGETVMDNDGVKVSDETDSATLVKTGLTVTDGTNATIITKNAISTTGTLTAGAGDNKVILSDNSVKVGTNAELTSTLLTIGTTSLNSSNLTLGEVNLASVSEGLVKLTNVASAGWINGSNTNATNANDLYGYTYDKATIDSKIHDGDEFAVLYDHNGPDRLNSVTLAGGNPELPVAIKNVAEGDVAQDSTYAVTGGQLWTEQQARIAEDTALTEATGKITGTHNIIKAYDETSTETKVATNLAANITAIDTAIGKIGTGTNYLAQYDAADAENTNIAANLTKLDAKLGKVTSTTNGVEEANTFAANIDALNAALGNTNNYGSYNYVADGDSAVEAIGKLDSAVGSAFAAGYTFAADNDTEGKAISINKTISLNGLAAAKQGRTNIYTTLVKDENGNAAIEIALGEHVDVTDVTTGATKMNSAGITTTDGTDRYTQTAQSAVFADENNSATLTKTGLTVTDGTNATTITASAVTTKEITTETLTVNGTAEFNGKATFKEAVVFEKGADMNGKKITNVDNGEIAKNSKDAVNGGQVYDILHGGSEDIKANTVTIAESGQIAETDERAVNGKTLYGELRNGADGNYTRAENTAAKNLKTLDENLFRIDETTDAKRFAETDAAAQATGAGATALGYGNLVKGERSTAVGYGNAVTGARSGAFGDPNNVSGSGSYAIGNDNTIANSSTFVLGSNVTTTQDNSVILGSGSTDRAPEGDAAGVVSVGSETELRQIINLAAGTQDTDAVNVKQMNDAISAGVGTRGVSYDEETRETITLGTGAADSITRITRLAAGEVSPVSTDAINGAQLYARDLAINANTQEIREVGAISAALAGLHFAEPSGEEGDKLVGAVAYGGYRGAGAEAIGLAYKPSPNMMLSASTSISNGNDSQNAYNVGFSLKFGKGNTMATRAELRKQVQFVNEENRVLKNQIVNLSAENAEQTAKMAEQDEKLKTQEEQLESQNEKIKLLEKGLEELKKLIKK